METVDCSSTWGREQGSRRNCEVFGLRSARGQEREDRGSSDSLSRIAGDRDTVENRRAVGGRDADHGDCKCVVVYSGSRGDRGCEERLLRLSWEADSLW